MIAVIVRNQGLLPLKEGWDYTSLFERLDPMVLGVQQVLGVSDDELDSLFELTATL